MAEVLGELVSSMLEMEDDISPEIKEQLSEVKQGIADEYINKLVKENPAMLVLKDQIKDYLVNEGGVKDAFLDIFRQHGLSILLPNQIDNLNYVKEKLSGIKEIPTSSALTELKSEIIDGHVLENPTTTSSSVDANQGETTGPETASSEPASSEPASSEPAPSEPASSEPTSREGRETASQAVPEHIDGLSESQGRFIEEVYKAAASQIGVKYKWGGVSPETGFDCSGLWNWAFKQQGIKFKQRLTAATFSGADVDVAKDQVTVGDFMYWDQKPGKKRHNSIYHIEMVISKPYQKNGKMYVRTLGSSTDTKDDCRNYVGNGVRVREREMKDYRHFGRPPYYYQLAEYEKTGNKDALVATTAKPSSEVADKIA